MDFSWSEEQLEFKKAVIKFAKGELNEGLTERDSQGVLSRENWQKCAEFGILGLPIPEEYGGAGADMRALFRMLRNADEFDDFADDLARRTVKHVDVTWIPGDALERLALKKLLTWIAPRLSGERSIRRSAFSPEVRRGIERYLFGPTYRQLRDEIGYIPDEMTFVFGHTHKPFEAVLDIPERRQPLGVYNTGGWPIDSQEPFAAIGASILFLNARLDSASLRIFNDGEAGGDVSLELRSAVDDSPAAEFGTRLAARVRDGGGSDGLAEPWSGLRTSIQDAILRRRQLHQGRPG